VPRRATRGEKGCAPGAPGAVVTLCRGQEWKRKRDSVSGRKRTKRCVLHARAHPWKDVTMVLQYCHRMGGITTTPSDERTTPRPRNLPT